MNTFNLHILASDKTFYEGECESLIIPTNEGQFGIMAHHRNMIAAILPGTLSFRVPGEKKRTAAVSGGMIKVEDNDVLILADTAERPEDIDIKRAEADIARSKEEILQKRSINDYYLAQARMARAMSRIQVKKSQNI